MDSNDQTPEPTVLTADESVASSQVETGYLSGPGFTDVPVRYSVVDGTAFYQGCIDMGPVEEVRAHAEQVRERAARAFELPLGGPHPGDGQGGTNGGGDGAPDALLDDLIVSAGIGRPTTSSALWTNGVVPYVIDNGLPNKARVTDAMAHLAANSPIRFVPRTGQNDYVRFIRNPGVNWSSSPIGRRGGRQTIRVSDGASMGTVVHECCHSLGILHEQSRCDRDAFVTINYANIDGDFDSNFDKFCSGFTDYFDYDYGSIMHYGPTAFSTNGQPTIVPKKAGVSIGQRTGLSTGDRLTIAEMYSRFTGKGHTGVWRAGSGKYALWANASWPSFQSKWQLWAQQGLRLVDVDVRVTSGGSTRYSGVWMQGTGSHALWANASWDSFKAKWQLWGQQGLRLVDMSVHGSGSSARYSGVWRPGNGGYALWVNASWDSFTSKWQQWGAQGLRLVDINVQRDGGQTRYSGVWLPGQGGYALWANASWGSFLAKWKQFSQQGLRLVDINVHRSGSATRYSGVWLPGNDAYYLWANAPWEGFKARWQELAPKGLRLIDYERTISQDAADVLDEAGLPVAASADADEPFGGVYDADGDELEEAMAVMAGGMTGAAAEAAPDETGTGGMVPAQAGSPTDTHAMAAASEDADDGEGVGGLMTEQPAAAADGAHRPQAGSQQDGVGGMVAQAADGLVVSTASDEPEGQEKAEQPEAAEGSDGVGGMQTASQPDRAGAR